MPKAIAISTTSASSPVVGAGALGDVGTVSPRPRAFRPDWHGWLHYTTNALPPAGGSPRKAWQKEHVANLTGTDFAYRPPGHTLSIGEKPKPPYEAWRPG